MAYIKNKIHIASRPNTIRIKRLIQGIIIILISYSTEEPEQGGYQLRIY